MEYIKTYELFSNKPKIGDEYVTNLIKDIEENFEPSKLSKHRDVNDFWYKDIKISIDWTGSCFPIIYTFELESKGKIIPVSWSLLRKLHKLLKAKYKEKEKDELRDTINKLEQPDMDEIGLI